MKERRQRAILTLVATRPIHSQDELVSLLSASGFDATQATVSRDIKELGLVKVPIKGESEDDALFKYVVPSASTQYVSRLHRVVAELVLQAEGSGNFIVLKTPPGSAMMVACALDEAAWPEVMGTIGGDDTILVIVRDATKTAMLVQRFLDLRGTSAA
ncbi:MAG: arginine repressor [Vulcanimicrobiaceae bacterium]